MSEFTIQELAESAIIGFSTDRSPAWWLKDSQVEEFTRLGICYPGALPVERVREFVGWTARTVDVSQVIAGLDMHDLPEGVNLRAVVQDMADGSSKLLAVNGGAYATKGPAETVMPMVEELVDLGCQVATAVNLRGRYIGTSMKIGDGADVELAGLGTARLHINATDSTDGTIPTTWHTSATLMVCDNTIRASVNGAVNTYRLRHTTNRQFDKVAAMEAVEVCLTNGQAWADHFNRMAEVKFTDQDLARFMDHAVSIEGFEPGRALTIRENKRAEINRLWTDDPRVGPLRGTLAGAVQVASTFDQWSSTARGSKNDNKRFLKGVSPTPTTDLSDTLQAWLKRQDRVLVSA